MIFNKIRLNRKMPIETLIKDLGQDLQKLIFLNIDKISKTIAIFDISAFHENSVAQANIKEIQLKDPFLDRWLSFDT